MGQYIHVYICAYIYIGRRQGLSASGPSKDLVESDSSPAIGRVQRCRCHVTGQGEPQSDLVACFSVSDWVLPAISKLLCLATDVKLALCFPLSVVRRTGGSASGTSPGCNPHNKVEVLYYLYCETGMGETGRVEI